MPDWRNPQEYAYCDHLTLYGWAWEFLRRNPDYISAWDSYVATETAMIAGNVDRDARDRAWRQACDPFGLSQPVDPSLSAPDTTNLRWRNEAGVLVIEEWHYSLREHWPGYPNRIALGFSFEKPLGPQIDDAVERLRACERHVREHDLVKIAPAPKGRARMDKYPLYLRLLDARKAGDNIYQIAKYFKKTWQACQLAIQAAEKMCADGYRDLPSKSSVDTKK